MDLITAIARWTLGLFFVAAGTFHFIHPETYQLIMPSYLPYPAALIAISGAAEIAGGIGILIPQVRRLAGYGLIALLIAVFPANINMAMHDIQLPGIHLTPIMQWSRLPLQLVFMAWVWWVALRKPADGDR